MMSDDSENDGVYVDKTHENSVYFKKYKLLLEECEAIQKNNEKLVYRIDEVKRMTKHKLDHVNYLKHRLKTLHSEDWTRIPQTVLEIPPVISSLPTPKIPVKHDTPKQGRGQQSVAASKSKRGAVAEEKAGGAKMKRAPKRKAPKAERDPRAPKRPSNPFFQFCQEQRQPLMEELIAALKPGQVEPNKQELTRQLAIKWKTLNTIEKQVYVDMYERSKEKYVAEMSEYNQKK